MTGALVCIVVSVGMIAAMVAVVAAIALIRSRAAVAESVALANALALRTVSRGKTTFYEGTHAGHPVALAHVYAAENLRGADARRTGEWRLRLLVGLRLDAPLGASVNRAFDPHARPALSGDFEADFRTREPDRIGAAARTSLTDFARTYEHVSLMDRGKPATAKFLGGSPVLADSLTVLIHDEPGIGQSVEDVRRVWDAMIAAVAPIETAGRDG